MLVITEHAGEIVVHSHECGLDCHHVTYRHQRSVAGHFQKDLGGEGGLLPVALDLDQSVLQRRGGGRGAVDMRSSAIFIILLCRKTVTEEYVDVRHVDNFSLAGVGTRLG